MVMNLKSKDGSIYPILAGLFLAFVGITSLPATAHILSLSGDVIQAAEPASLNYGAYPAAPGYGTFSNGLLSGVITPTPIIFQEYYDQAVPFFSQTPYSSFTGLLSGLNPSTFIGLDFIPVDLTTAGSFPFDTPVIGEIPSGTAVSTFIFHFEASDVNALGSASGSVTFSGTILGVQTSAFSSYPFRELLFDQPNVSLAGSTGMEICDPAGSDYCDMVSISSDLHTLSFQSQVHGATDDMRIFVTPTQGMSSVPEPSSLILLGGSIICFHGLRRRNRRTNRASCTDMRGIAVAVTCLQTHGQVS